PPTRNWLKVPILPGDQSLENGPAPCSLRGAVYCPPRHQHRQDRGDERGADHQPVGHAKQRKHDRGRAQPKNTTAPTSGGRVRRRRQERKRIPAANRPATASPPKETISLPLDHPRPRRRRPNAP